MISVAEIGSKPRAGAMPEVIGTPGSHQRSGQVDETARILAEIGRPVSRCEYAIHEAYRLYRVATADPFDQERFNVARATRRRALTAALLAYDVEKEAGESDTFTISQARRLLEPMPAELSAVLARH